MEGAALLHFNMAPNRAIPADKTMDSSPLAAAQPSIHLSWPVALNASGPGVPPGWPSAAMLVSSLSRDQDAVLLE